MEPPQNECGGFNSDKRMFHVKFLLVFMEKIIWTR